MTISHPSPQQAAPARRRRSPQETGAPRVAGRLAVVAALTVTLTGGVAPIAVADPADDGSGSTQQDERSVNQRVAQIEADLAVLAGQRDDAWMRAGLAAEDATDAQMELEAAKAEVEAAQAALDEAEAGEAGARSAMGAT
ncbi:hypothetical protein DLJ96_12640, partial [Actinotalea fermentans ATCC 43279 = JCM 9966 = DSM 3133]